MKNTAYLLGLSVFFLFSGITNVIAQPTTEEEYNYVTKGYKIQLESGLDMKAGYKLKDIGEWNLKYDAVSRGLVFKGLYRGDDVKPCAVMAIYQKKVGDKKKTRLLLHPDT